tara:strand:- start:6096 stop:6932 length:837 start_codon:yes stop_codon:yes gene_type:complete
MKILSIDIGIKNLAYVILELEDNNYYIKDWCIVDLTNETFKCLTCSKNAKYVKGDLYYCSKHNNLSGLPIFELSDSKLKKQNLKQLCTLANKYVIDYQENIKKQMLYDLIVKYRDNSCLQNVVTYNAKDLNLIDIGVNIKQKFNEIFCNSSIYADIDNVTNKKIDISSIDIILLENQIGPIANRMKTIQGMVAQYFIDKDNYNIKFISSINKLKPFTREKLTYKERKQKSIEIAEKLIYNQDRYYRDLYKNSKKKDDLSDCFLQAISFLINNKELKID